MADLKITDTHRDIIRRSTINANPATNDYHLKLPNQLDRKLYVEINKIIEAAGGKWSKKFQAHVLTTDPDTIFGLIEKEVVVDEKKARQAFYTPDDLAATMADIARPSGKIVLEPSAGGGALVQAALAVGSNFITAIESDLAAATLLKAKPWEQSRVGVKCADFLKLEPEDIYDVVMMNPPFSKGQCYRHVLHAVQFLAPREGSILVSVLPANQTSLPYLRFREQLDASHVVLIKAVASGTFKESGTGVETILLVATPRNVIK